MIILAKDKLYIFDAVIEAVPNKHGAYVRFPYDIKKESGKGRIKFMQHLMVLIMTAVL